MSHVTYIIYITHMVKLIFKAGYIIKNKTKKGFQKRHVKGTKIFLKKKKAKSVSMLVSNIEIFLKTKK